MRTLDPIELEVLLDFISPDGWVFDLGIDRFNTFTERVIGVRVKDVYPNLSKGKALRRFVSEPGNEEKGYKLITALMKYYELKIRGTKHPDVRPEEQFEKCRNILKSYESAFNRSATNPDYGHIKEKFLNLYKDGAYWKQGDPAIGLAIALEPMTDLVRFCIANKIDGLFSNALFIRTLVEIQSLGGEGTKPQESQQAEAAWNTFISVLLPYITLFSKRKNVSLVEFKIFLDNHKQIYTNRNGFYRNINAEPIIGLLERCKMVAMSFHREHEAMLETMYAGVFADEWEQFDFLLASDKPAPPQIEAEVQMNISITRDIKYRGEDKEDTIAEKVAAKLREEPINAIVDGYTPKGKKESVLIANTKLTEKGFFSDPNLCILFEVSPNTPYNWRTGKAKAPDGFAEAWEKKDEKAMRRIAEKYKANRGKTDVMNKKDRVSGLSDEEMYKMGAKMPNGNIGNPQ